MEKPVKWECYPYKNGSPLKLLSSHKTIMARSAEEAERLAWEYYRNQGKTLTGLA